MRRCFTHSNAWFWVGCFGIFMLPLWHFLEPSRWIKRKMSHLHQTYLSPIRGGCLSFPHPKIHPKSSVSLVKSVCMCMKFHPSGLTRLLNDSCFPCTLFYASFFPCVSLRKREESARSVEIKLCGNFDSRLFIC